MGISCVFCKTCFISIYIISRCRSNTIQNWNPDEDQDAPWAAKTPLADVYSNDDAIRAIRMCVSSVFAIELNSLNIFCYFVAQTNLMFNFILL